MIVVVRGGYGPESNSHKDGISPRSLTKVLNPKLIQLPKLSM